MFPIIDLYYSKNIVLNCYKHCFNWNVGECIANESEIIEMLILVSSRLILWILPGGPLLIMIILNCDLIFVFFFFAFVSKSHLLFLVHDRNFELFFRIEVPDARVKIIYTSSIKLKLLGLIGIKTCLKECCWIRFDSRR